MNEYSQRVGYPGAVILCDGKVLDTKEVLALLKDHAMAKIEAEGLAMFMWKKFYQEAAPDFGLCNSVAGVMSQIDNMVTGLILASKEA